MRTIALVALLVVGLCLSARAADVIAVGMGLPEAEALLHRLCPSGKRAISLSAAGGRGCAVQNVSNIPSPYCSAASSRSQSVSS
jgi:hypothetical protein